ncbi:hypothetical protein D7U91_00790 [Stenotrophomonas maltophilia]|uniref:hypothetical protein n=1 Tax=Stenotrophomonas maltophilia TaxID=40324 RepID=UPI0015E019AD|nr:hypothetical protein [Stenotrophomonas maltophilia]MBA0386376.1 hypothetical protein [Stenotrophomonas maltophilia]MBA0390641.1 hypothetical protein [Stenotrophomonas maltophilia]MBA0463452.1 hypothetical protein [Stenotrophomonas maltophilia]MBA0471516.1 hypothetical protein [Stenotrophomonas maltophilia]
MAVLLLMVAAVVIRLAFWTYTDRVWEDALITVLHAENLFQVGKLSHFRVDDKVVHGFTSPISVLVPIIGGALDWKGTYALPFIQLISALTGALTVLLGYRVIVRAKEPNQTAWMVFTLVYLAFEHHQILWGMAGMETQMVVATILFAFYAATTGNPKLIGLALALALYARPDFAFLNIIIVVFTYFVVGKGQAVKSVLIGAALYAPWLIFTTLYYGSPLPNTILAKAYGYAPQKVSLVQKLLDFWVPMGPSFAGNGTGYWRLWDHGAISIAVILLFAFSAYSVVHHRTKALYVPVAFVLVYWAYYVFAVSGVFGWYVVPVSAATSLVAGYGLARLIRNRKAAITVAVAYIAAMVTVLPTTFKAEHDIQANIEAPVREAMGRYLGAVMRPTDKVGMEPLGYSSYYSRHVILDYPGLINPDVVAYTKEHRAAGLCTLVSDFLPEYVALREYECKGSPWIAQHYIEIRNFRSNTAAVNNFMIEHNIDRHFLLYRRSDVPAVAVPAQDAQEQPQMRGLADPILNQTSSINTGAPLQVTAVDLHGDFAHDGYNAEVGQPSLKTDIYGSWTAKGDAGIGHASLSFLVPAGVDAIAVPVLTGPSATHARFEVSDNEQTIDQLSDSPGLGHWRLWAVPVSAQSEPRTITINVTDSGNGWGEWTAIGAPYVMQKHQYPTRH